MWCFTVPAKLFRVKQLVESKPVTSQKIKNLMDSYNNRTKKGLKSNSIYKSHSILKSNTCVIRLADNSTNSVVFLLAECKSQLGKPFRIFYKLLIFIMAIIPQHFNKMHLIFGPFAKKSRRLCRTQWWILLPVNRSKQAYVIQLTHLWQN